MPITPFHFGPGAALKAVAPAHFSFTVFCYSQVVTDLESGFYLLRGEFPVHRFFHTYVGAACVGLACAVTGRAVCQFALRVGQACSPEWLTGTFGKPGIISWRVAFLSAFLGTYSHVFLDSIMHRDMKPLNPFSAANPLLHVVSLQMLHVLCFTLGVVGAMIVLFRAARDNQRA